MSTGVERDEGGKDGYCLCQGRGDGLLVPGSFSELSEGSSLLHLKGESSTHGLEPGFIWSPVEGL